MGKVLDLNKIQKPKDRMEATQKLASSVQPIGVYSPVAFNVKFGGEVVTIEKGFHEYAPAFALWLIQKYGPESTYGKVHYTVKENGKDVTKPCPVLLDYDPTPKQAEFQTSKAK